MANSAIAEGVGVALEAASKAFKFLIVLVCILAPLALWGVWSLISWAIGKF